MKYVDNMLACNVPSVLCLPAFKLGSHFSTVFSLSCNPLSVAFYFTVEFDTSLCTLIYYAETPITRRVR